MSVSVRFFTGFETENDPALYKSRWTLVDNPELQVGRFGEGLCLSQTTNLTDISYTLSGSTFSGSAAVAGIAIKVNGIFSARILGISNSSGVQFALHAIYESATTFKLSVWLGTSLVAETTEEFPMGEWMYVELYVYPHNTNGVYEVRVNQITVLEDSFIDTQFQASSGVSKFVMRWILTSGYILADDLYLATVDSNIPQFLGDIRVVEAIPFADYEANFTPNPTVDENVENIEAEISDGDSSYNEESVTEAFDLFEAIPDDLYKKLSRVYGVHGSILVKSTKGTDTNNIGPNFANARRSEQVTPYSRAPGAVEYSEVRSAISNDLNGQLLENQEVKNLKIGYRNV